MTIVILSFASAVRSAAAAVADEELDGITSTGATPSPAAVESAVPAATSDAPPGAVPAATSDAAPGAVVSSFSTVAGATVSHATLQSTSSTAIS